MRLAHFLQKLSSDKQLELGKGDEGDKDEPR